MMPGVNTNLRQSAGVKQDNIARTPIVSFNGETNSSGGSPVGKPPSPIQKVSHENMSEVGSTVESLSQHSQREKDGINISYKPSGVSAASNKGALTGINGLGEKKFEGDLKNCFTGTVKAPKEPVKKVDEQSRPAELHQDPMIDLSFTSLQASKKSVKEVSEEADVPNKETVVSVDKQKLSPTQVKIIAGMVSALPENILVRLPASAIQTVMQQKENLTMSTRAAARAICNERGVGGFYVGFLPMTVTRVIQRPVVFVTTDVLNDKGVHPIIAATITTALETAIIGPVNYGMRNLQVLKGEGRSKSMWDEVSKARSHVVKSSVAEFPRNYMFNLVLAASRYVSTKEFADKHPVLFPLASAAAAVVVSHPFDPIQNRVATLKESFKEAASNIYRGEGFKGFSRGFTPRLVGVGGGCFVSLMTYNQLKKYV